MSKINRSKISIALAALLVGCSRDPSVLLDPAGPHAALTGKLFWFFCAVDAVIFFLVVGFLLLSLWRRREEGDAEPIRPPAKTERRLFIGVSICVALTAVVLTIFVITSFVVDRELIALDRDASVEIEITAHQWWWEVRYLGDKPSEIFTTANEIHVPLHEKVRFVLNSSDVIHSLWFPNLSGKRDIIPGRQQDLFIRADREGKWLGRCAEFCGMQHAKMEIVLFAEPKADFEKWKAHQRLPAAEPRTEDQVRGRQIFTTSSCTLCHSLRATDVTGYSNNAPDLTHLKSRTTIGAGAVPNTKGYLGGWITDPHGIKPGVHMPTILHEPRDFQALLNYLEILQ